MSEEEKAKPHNIVITTMYTEEYCGGAAPEDAVVDEMMTPKPYANKSFYIYSVGLGMGDEYQIKTDGNGQFKLKLTPGTYTMFLLNKKQADELIAAETDVALKECKRAKFTIPQSYFEVLPGEFTSIMEYNIMCDPCEPPRP
jgi:hypothetical protein